jgi:hypothetical protein
MPNLKSTVASLVERALTRLDGASRLEVEALAREVDRLRRELDELKSRDKFRPKKQLDKTQIDKRS